MKKLLLICLMLCFLCAGCSTPTTQEEDTLTILATTYPVYLFTTAVTEGVDGITVTRLITEDVSCLHDYTLTVKDMKAIEKADVIVMNGVGFESFMTDALRHSDAPVIDCSTGLELLEACHSHGDSHDGHVHAHDPHIWLSPYNAKVMLHTIASELGRICPQSMHHAFDTACQTTCEKLDDACQRWEHQLQALPQSQLIPFHDGFRYFAAAFDLTLLKSIEEDAGSEASAAEIKEMVALIEQNNISAIFMEKNGSDATAKTIARETGVKVYALDMIMSGDGSGIQPYLDAMSANLDTVTDALGGG